MPDGLVGAGAAGDAPGWYGKLSVLGDFAQRRLPSDCIAVVDRWLVEAMRGARSTLGERWLEVYLSAPVLRFGWAPGVVDSRWWFGIVMPSCDSVGRYFPLVVTEARQRAPGDRIALDHLELWFEHLSKAALATLAEGDGASLDALEATLHDAPPWPTAGRGAVLSPVGARGTAIDGDEEARFAVPPTSALSHWLAAFAVYELGTRLAGCSVWWRATEGPRDDAVVVIRGLPDGVSFADLLQGA